MEKGLQRVLKFLDEMKLQVGMLVTDRHQQITKYIREQHPNIMHYYDVWHVAKGMLQYHSIKLNNVGFDFSF